MAKLSKSQLISVRKQAKAAREKALDETQGEKGTDRSAPARKDSLGLTREERDNIRKMQSSLPKSGPKITWNYNDGDLVYLPDNSIGMIVKNSAVDMSVIYSSTDMKKTMKANKYAGQVFVVTSAGNNWYYPSQLKKVKSD